MIFILMLGTIIDTLLYFFTNFCSYSYVAYYIALIVFDFRIIFLTPYQFFYYRVYYIINLRQYIFNRFSNYINKHFLILFIFPISILPHRLSIIISFNIF